MNEQNPSELTAAVGEVSRRSEAVADGHHSSTLEAEYRAAAKDADAEREAHEWLEANVDDALDDE